MNDPRPLPVDMMDLAEPQSLPVSRRSLLGFAVSAPVVTMAAEIGRASCRERVSYSV